MSTNEFLFNPCGYSGELRMPTEIKMRSIMVVLRVWLLWLELIPTASLPVPPGLERCALDGCRDQHVCTVILCFCLCVTYISRIYESFPRGLCDLITSPWWGGGLGFYLPPLLPGPSLLVVAPSPNSLSSPSTSWWPPLAPRWSRISLPCSENDNLVKRNRDT